MTSVNNLRGNQHPAALEGNKRDEQETTYRHTLRTSRV